MSLINLPNLGRLALSGTTDEREGLKTAAKIALDVVPGNGARIVGSGLYKAGRIGMDSLKAVEGLSGIYEHEWGFLGATPASDSLIDRLFE